MKLGWDWGQMAEGMLLGMVLAVLLLTGVSGCRLFEINAPAAPAGADPTKPPPAAKPAADPNMPVAALTAGQAVQGTRDRMTWPVVIGLFGAAASVAAMVLGARKLGVAGALASGLLMGLALAIQAYALQVAQAGMVLVALLLVGVIVLAWRHRQYLVQTIEFAEVVKDLPPGADLEPIAEVTQTAPGLRAAVRQIRDRLGLRQARAVAQAKTAGETPAARVGQAMPAKELHAGNWESAA